MCVWGCFGPPEDQVGLMSKKEKRGAPDGHLDPPVDVGVDVDINVGAIVHADLRL